MWIPQLIQDLENYDPYGTPVFIEPLGEEISGAIRTEFPLTPLLAMYMVELTVPMSLEAYAEATYALDVEALRAELARLECLDEDGLVWCAHVWWNNLQVIPDEGVFVEYTEAVPQDQKAIAVYPGRILEASPEAVVLEAAPIPGKGKIIDAPPQGFIKEGYSPAPGGVEVFPINLAADGILRPLRTGVAQDLARIYREEEEEEEDVWRS